VSSFALSDRQHRFLDLVLRHSGVFVGRQYATFAGITHGQKVHDFIARMLAHGYARPIALGPNRRTRLFHLHYKPLYRAIGETDNRHRRRPTIEQALERLLVLDGVLMDPSVSWLGTEREKRAHFDSLGGLDLRDNHYPRLIFGRAPRQTVRLFPDKLPIGHAEYGRRHVFLYPVHSVDLVHFCLFLARHHWLLNALPFWTIRVLVPRPLMHHAPSFQWAAQMTLASPLHMDQMPELLWFFEVTSRADESELRQHAERLRAARRVFRGPRFIALRRWWHQVGDAPLHVVKSQVLRDQMERGRGAVEVVEAPHDYRYLRSLAGLRTPGGGERWGDEPHGRDVHLTGAANAAGGEAPNSRER
jgi:hypothetical protein